jgi:hypothetical protein
MASGFRNPTLIFLPSQPPFLKPLLPSAQLFPCHLSPLFITPFLSAIPSFLHFVSSSPLFNDTPGYDFGKNVDQIDPLKRVLAH